MGPAQDLAAAVDAGLKEFEESLGIVETPSKEAKSRVLVVKPAFRWAQNATHLFVEARMAHSLNAPANTDAFVESAVAEPRALRLSAASARQKDKRWELTIEDLWGELDVSASDTSATMRAGKVVLFLGKAKKHIKWPRFLGCGAKNPAMSGAGVDV